MHRIVAIVFDQGTEAEEGKKRLLQLDSEGSIATYGYAVVGKKADGKVVLRQVDLHGTMSPYANSLLESLCDSACPNAESDATQAGFSAADSNRSKRADSFIHDILELLLPNRVAIVAEVEEECPPVLDRHMESIGGVVFRWETSEVQRALEM